MFIVLSTSEVIFLGKSPVNIKYIYMKIYNILLYQLMKNKKIVNNIYINIKENY